jgi:hypothetical protein
MSRARWCSHWAIVWCEATSASSTQIIAGNGLFRSTGDGGPARNAPVYDVMGLAADAAGNVYFTERDGNCVRKVSPAGVVSTIAGTGLEAATAMADLPSARNCFCLMASQRMLAVVCT